MYKRVAVICVKRLAVISMEAWGWCVTVSFTLDEWRSFDCRPRTDPRKLAIRSPAVRSVNSTEQFSAAR